MRHVAPRSPIFCATAVLLLLLALDMVRPRTAYACYCFKSSPGEAFVGADVVFVGTVAKITQASDTDVGSLRGSNMLSGSFVGSMPGKVVQLEPISWWKGAKNPAVTPIVVNTGSGGGDCGVQFVEGQRWLVYASGRENLYTNICTRTRPLEYAKEDVARLGPGEPPLDRDTLAQVLQIDKSELERLDGATPYIRLAIASAISVGCLAGLLWLRRWRKRKV